MLALIVGCEAAGVQVACQTGDFEARVFEIFHGVLKQAVVVGLEPDFAAVFQKRAILPKLAGMRQAVLGLLGALVPRVAERDVDALHPILPGQIFIDVFNVEVRQDQVVHFAHAAVGFLGVAARHAQHGRDQIDRQIVVRGILQRHLAGGNALAAAQLQIHRLRLRKARRPAAARALRVDHIIRARRKLRPRPLFHSHSHASDSPLYISSRPSASITSGRAPMRSACRL